MKKSLIDLYKKYFTFTEEDNVFVDKRHEKYLLIMLPIILVFSLFNMLLDEKIAPDKIRYGSPAFIYYTGIFFLSLLCLSITLYTRKTTGHHKYKLLCVYITYMMFYGFSLFNIYYHKVMFNGYIVIFIYSLIFIMIFEISPIFWSVNIIAVYVAVLLMTLSIEDVYYFVNAGIFLALTIPASFWKRYHTVRELHQKQKLAAIHRKSEKLLNNILPEKVVRELEETGRSEPEYFENVSILYTDIVNFTETSKSLSPKVLLEELNDIFGHFDIIVDKWGCTRIKTIGDAYMAACGMPEENPQHAYIMTGCAREFLKYLEMRNETSEIKWQMRVGIHSGSVTAGIVGIKKYIYDVFGETVSTASRMEHYSQPMRINVSWQTHELLKKNFSFEENEVKADEIKEKMYLLKK